MQKNPLQHTHQYPLHFKWSLQRTEKNATDREIPQYPLQFKWSLTMEREIEIYAPGKRSQIAFKWSLQRTDVISSNPLQFRPRCRNFKPTSCFFFFFFLENPLRASIWWSNEMWEGSEKGGKILAEIFSGNWEREMVFAEFAMVILNWSELTWQYRSCGLHKVKNFTILPLSYVTQKLKTPIWCFQFSAL